MNPLFLILIAILWIATFGGVLLAYLEKKFDRWGVALAILFVLALVATVLGIMSMGHGTATMN